MKCLPVQEGKIDRMGTKVVVWRDYLCHRGMRLRLWINPDSKDPYETVESVLLSIDY